MKYTPRIGTSPGFGLRWALWNLLSGLPFETMARHVQRFGGRMALPGHLN